MNAWLVSGEAAWQLAGWTMLHFLWVGAVVALVGGAMRVACRRARPGVRYGVSLLTLAGLAAAPVGIAIWLAGQGLESYGLSTNGVAGDFESRTSASLVEPRGSSTWAGARDPRSRPYEEPRVIDLARTPIVVEETAGGVKSEVIEIQAPSGISFDAVASYLPWVWLAGAPVTFALLATGLVGSRLLRRQCAAVTEGAACEALERIKKLMRVTQRVALAACEHVAQPVLVGIVRPTILLPAAALTGWSPEELEMVLVHELAHVRRWDNLVNLLQRLVESALFFHPAVWLASRQVRRDRERRRDAAVVAHTRRPVEYAELLVSIAGRRRRPRAEAQLALALADHPLAGRIRRILKLEDEPMWVSRSTLGLVFVLGASLLAAVMALPPTGGAVADDASTPPSPVAAATDGGAEEAQNTPRASTPRAAQRDKGTKARIKASEAKRQAEAKRWEGHEDDARQNFLEFELPKLKNDIAFYQSQLLPLLKEQEDIEALKDKALQDSRSPAALEAAVAAELRKDPTIAKYQQQLFKVEQNIQQQRAAGRRDPKSARLQELIAEKNQTETMLKQYKEHAEKAARDRLAKVPNEALRSAMVEYQIRAASIATRKAELEQKQKDAEDRITEMAKPPEATYADAGGPNFEMRQVQEKILAYQAELMAQEKELQDLEVRKELAAMQAQRAASGDARVEKELERDRRTKIYEDEAIELEKHLRALKGETTQAGQERYEHVKTQYEQLFAEADEYRQEASRKYRERLEKQAQEMLDSSRVEYEIHAQALERRHAELTKKLNEAEAQYKELAKSAKEQAASASRDNRYFYYSNQPRTTAASPQSFDGGTPAGQPYQQNQPSESASQEPASYTQPAGLGPAAAYTPPAKPASAKRTLQPGDVIRVTAAGVFPDQPLGDEFQVEEEGAVPLGPMYGRVDVAGRTVLEAQEAIERHLETMFKDPSVQVVLAGPAFGWTSQPAPQPGPGTQLLYDGKSFAQWQQLWQNELKTEKRTEAIEALAAFGRAGMAKEAAEAILEVAGQYDFYTIDNQDGEGQLKQRVIQLLTTTSSSRLRESAWMPALVRRLKDDPPRWKWLAWQLLNSLTTEDEEVREHLFDLTRSEDEEISNASLRALANSDPMRTNPRVMAVIEQQVESDEPESVKMGINMLVYSPTLPGGRWTRPKVRNAEKIAPHLFHKDESVRQTAREALASLDAGDAGPMVENILARLKESDDEAMKLAAIRGLAAIGPNAAEAETAMRELIAGHEPKLAAAAVVAVDRMHPGSSPGMRALQDHLSTNAPTAGDGLHVDDQMIEREREALFTPRENQGGGGFGGGGRGGF